MIRGPSLSARGLRWVSVAWMVGLHHNLWEVQTVQTLITASDAPFYRPKRSLPYSTLHYFLTSVVTVGPVLLTKLNESWLSLTTHVLPLLMRQHRISQDNATQLINFRQCHAQPSPPPSSQDPNVQNDAKAWLRAYCMVLEVVFRLNFSSCGNRSGFSFDDARLHLNGRFWQSNFKRFKLNILVNFRDFHS